MGILSAVVVALLLFAGEVSAATNFPGYEVTINKSECSEANSGKYVNIWKTKDCLRKCNDSDDCVAFIYQPKRRHCKLYEQCTLKANPDPVTKTLLYTKESQPESQSESSESQSESSESQSESSESQSESERQSESESQSESKSTDEIQSISPCDEEVNPRWQLFQNSMCAAGQEHFTLRKGETIVHETDPYDDDAGGIEDSQEYDGTLSMCQEVFVMDYWERLQNEDIRLGRDSWLTWDPKDGSCMLYSLTEDCQQLRSGAETEGMVSAHYCNFNS